MVVRILVFGAVFLRSLQANRDLAAKSAVANPIGA